MKNDLAASERWHREELELARRLTAAAPENRSVKRCLAESLARLGSLRVVASDKTGAAPLMEESLAAFRSMIAKNPLENGPEREMASTLGELAELKIAAHDYPAATELYRTSLPLLVSVAGAAPTSASAARHYAMAAKRVAELTDEPAAWTQAVAAYEALERLGALTDDDRAALADTRAKAAAPERAMSDVYISYKREDRDRVQALAVALQGAGFGVWWDRDLEGGANWRARMEEELNAARCVIVVWSRLSRWEPSGFVHDEAQRGAERGVLLPVKIDDVRPPLGFGGRQALDLTGWSGDLLDARWRGVRAAVDAGAGRAGPLGPGAGGGCGRWRSGPRRSRSPPARWGSTPMSPWSTGPPVGCR